ncbi:hypothetical protein F4778DRAFT_564985 [Xylariomycetidae sp. FL2044]|nr:hypothetical protein F4778DRAFT_564985 [Xylariomycetidae sp. FL2044]
MTLIGEMESQGRRAQKQIDDIKREIDDIERKNADIERKDADIRRKDADIRRKDDDFEREMRRLKTESKQILERLDALEAKQHNHPAHAHPLQQEIQKMITQQVVQEAVHDVVETLLTQELFRQAVNNINGKLLTEERFREAVQDIIENYVEINGDEIIREFINNNAEDIIMRTKCESIVAELTEPVMNALEQRLQGSIQAQVEAETVASSHVCRSHTFYAVCFDDACHDEIYLSPPTPQSMRQGVRRELSPSTNSSELIPVLTNLDTSVAGPRCRLGLLPFDMRCLLLPTSMSSSANHDAFPSTP